MCQQCVTFLWPNGGHERELGWSLLRWVLQGTEGPESEALGFTAKAGADVRDVATGQLKEIIVDL